MSFLNAPPGTLVALSLLAALGLAWLAYRPLWRTAPCQGAILTALRGLFLILLILFLYRPVLQRQRPVTVANRFVVLVDASASMGLADAAGKPRNAPLLAAVRDLLGKLPPGMEPVVIRFAANANRVATVDGIGADGMATDLGGALDAAGGALADRPAAGVLVVTDGVSTRGRSPVQTAAELNQRRRSAELPGARGGKVPIYAVIPEAGDAGTRIVSATAPPATLADRPVTITATVQGRGPLTVDLYEELAPGRERKLTTAANLAPGEAVLTPSLVGTGAHRLRLACAGPGPDPTPADNTRRLTVKVLASPEVLLLAGKLSWEYRYLRAALEMLKGITVNVCVYDDTRSVYGFGEHALQLTKTATWTPAAVAEYAAIILLDAGPELITASAGPALQEAVGRGRVGLVVAGRDSYRDNPRLTGWLPAAPVMSFPTRPGPVTPVAASASSALAVRIPPFDGGDLGVGFTLTPAAQPLARYGTGAGDPAAIVTGRSGLGRVILVGPELWPAAFTTRADSSAILAFWQDVVRYLTPNSWLRARPSFPPGGAIPGEEVAVAVEAEADVRTVEYRVSGPGLDRNGTIPAGQPLRFLPRSPGDYLVEVNPAGSVKERVGLNIPVLTTYEEYGVTDREPGVLEALTRESGGRVVPVDRLAELIPELTGRTEMTRAETVDLWDHPGWLLFLAALLAAEWFLRRRWGLL